MISSLALARLCGVSQGTVDRALHGRPGVSEQTRTRILQEAEKSGYRPHPAARELITGVSRMVGAVVPSVNNVFFMDIFQSLGVKLKERNLTFQLTLAETREDFLEVLEEFASRRFRIVLAIPPEEGITIPASVTSCFPVVSLASPCLGERVTFLSPDEEATGRQALRYLYKKGHRRVVHLTYGRDAHAITARARGYETEARKLGLASRIIRDIDEKTLSAVIEAERPTAFFCHNDWLALMVMLVLSDLGLRVPEDISVLGVDHGPTLSRLAPNLTTLAYPFHAVENAFLKHLDGDETGEETVTKARFVLKERRTVGVAVS